MRKRDMDFNNLIVDIETEGDAQNFIGMQATVESLAELDGYAVVWTPEGAEDDTVPAVVIPTNRIRLMRVWPNTELDEADEAEELAEEAARIAEMIGDDNQTENQLGPEYDD